MTILYSELDLDRAFETIADELAKIVQYDWLSVTVDEAYGISKVAFARGADGWSPPDPSSGEAKQPNTETAWAQIPLGAPGRPGGYVSISSSRVPEFDELSLEYVQVFAAQLAPAIENARMHQNALPCYEKVNSLPRSRA